MRLLRWCLSLLLCFVPLTLLCVMIWLWILPGRIVSWWRGEGVDWPLWARVGEAMIAFARRLDGLADVVAGNT